MTGTPMPSFDEAARQHALDRYHILDTLPEAAYDDIVQLASQLCGTPTALITLIDRDRQWFKARTGFDDTQTSRSVAVCDHAIRAPGQLMEIEDLAQDPRFASNPYVSGDIGSARFYAGMPLTTPEGAAIGTVCVVDDQPRTLDERQRTALQSLAQLTMTLLEARARERALEHETFVATTVPAPATPGGQAPDRYLLALMELQDLAGATERLGERTTEKLLQRLDEALEQALPDGGRDAINRTSGSAEYVAMLHGPDAPRTLDRLRALLDAQGDAHGLLFLIGVADADTAETPGAVFMRADADLLQRRTERLSTP